ncbi:RlmE family RNA methyltransferase [Candidatus Woesearchaeota archaeon]|nr:RlmE family RNA methyltransferase [Candidatus Woesearchaeota archaeon]
MYQRKDKFFRKARTEGYRARSIYKLREINNKCNLLRKKDKVLDLGCAPGSWLEEAKNLVDNGLIVGVDMERIKPLIGTTFIQGNINDEETLEEIEDASESFDVILSDLAPKTTGVKEIDQFQAMNLNLRVLEVCDKFLKKGSGRLLMKVFHGTEFQNLLKAIKKKFGHIKAIKPRASRKESKEVYIVAKDFKS